MQRLLELLKTKKGRAGILAALAALVFLITGQRIPEEKLQQADEAIEATVEVVSPGPTTPPTSAPASSTGAAAR